MYAQATRIYVLGAIDNSKNTNKKLGPECVFFKISLKRKNAPHVIVTWSVNFQILKAVLENNWREFSPNFGLMNMTGLSVRKFPQSFPNFFRPRPRFSPSLSRSGSCSNPHQWYSSGSSRDWSFRGGSCRFHSPRPSGSPPSRSRFAALLSKTFSIGSSRWSWMSGVGERCLNFKMLENLNKFLNFLRFPKIFHNFLYFQLFSKFYWVF